MKRNQLKGVRWCAQMIARTLAAAIAVGPGVPAIAGKGASHSTATPIQHLIVIVGENHTFDNLFATYQPVNGQSVVNLLSQGIVNADGTQGTNFSKSAQQTASDTHTDGYSIKPTPTGAYVTLPQSNTTYAFGQTPNVPDPRFPSSLPNGPFQISKYTAYQQAFTGDPVHRFFQMWQQYDEGALGLFTWVAETAGTGSNGVATPFPTNQGPADYSFRHLIRHAGGLWKPPASLSAAHLCHGTGAAMATSGRRQSWPRI